MQELADQLAAHQCPKHGSPICFVYKGILLKDESRMMCDECINPRNATQLINIKKAFRLLEAQQIQESNQIYQQKASIWQRFKRDQVQILDMLNCLQLEIMDRINSIKEDGVIMRISDQFLNKLTSQQQLMSLGQLLCNLIDQDNDGQYKLKQVQTKWNYSFHPSNQILDLNNTLMELRDNILQQDQIQQNQQLQAKSNKVQVDNSKYSYETTQTIQIKNYIQWLCFNHDETQIIASSLNVILIFSLSLQGKWVKGEFSSLGHNGQIWKAKFNHNSTLVASCSSDKMANGLYMTSQAAIVVYSVCFNHDSTLLASGSKDKTIIIHALLNGKWIISEVLAKHTSYVYDVCFNHNTTLLASASDKLFIWQQNAQGKWIVKQKLYGLSKVVLNVQFNSDFTQLISSSMDNTINIYSVDMNGFWISMQTLYEHQDRVNNAYMNYQANLIVSSSNDKSIKIWKVNNEHNWECKQTILQHNDQVQCTIISSDSLMIISGSYDKTIKVHERRRIL